MIGFIVILMISIIISLGVGYFVSNIRKNEIINQLKHEIKLNYDDEKKFKARYEYLIDLINEWNLNEISKFRNSLEE